MSRLALTCLQLLEHDGRLLQASFQRYSRHGRREGGDGWGPPHEIRAHLALTSDTNPISDPARTGMRPLLAGSIRAAPSSARLHQALSRRSLRPLGRPQAIRPHSTVTALLSVVENGEALAQTSATATSLPWPTIGAAIVGFPLVLWAYKVSILTPLRGARLSSFPSLTGFPTVPTQVRHADRVPAQDHLHGIPPSTRPRNSESAIASHQSYACSPFVCPSLLASLLCRRSTLPNASSAESTPPRSRSRATGESLCVGSPYGDLRTRPTQRSASSTCKVRLLTHARVGIVT